MQGDWITMETLGTFGGVVFIVTLIVQFLKDVVDRWIHLPTRFLALLIAWAVLLGRSYFLGGDGWTDQIFLDLLNGFLVTLTAMGTHSVAKDHLNWK